MELVVKDMMCEHCKAKILKGLEKAEIEATVNLSRKVVTINESDEEEARAIIKKLGYDVK